ncbi:MAG: hypothetical protein ACI9OJ_003748 [Myxococcota bacterium]|jgi:hypothetical protein
MQNYRYRMPYVLGQLATALSTLLVVAPALAAQGPAAANDQTSPPVGAREVRAHYVSEAPQIDGILDEAFWSEIAPTTDFRQRVPVDGAPSSEGTEVRVAFDENNLYFAVINRDSDPDRIRRSILHREGRIDQDDFIRIGLDTYNDKRNAYIFELNSFGTQGDALFTDESLSMSDWNWEGVYESEGRITDEGWIVEAAIPFTTIRFSDDDAPEMGILIERTIRRKNEVVYFPHIGQEFRNGLTQVSQYATLTGLEGLRRGRYMELKPFAIAGTSRFGQFGDVEGTSQGLSDVGLDFKYSVTSNLTVDATINPDFAQVESDNVQINLSRFSLFFPEKREFFLERAGLFSFGDSRQNEVFFSRRIGTTNDIVGGGRVTGQVGPVSVGALSLFTDDEPDGAGGLIRGGLNSVLRLRADPLPRTTVGGILTSLDVEGRSNRVAGADAQFRFRGSSAFEAWVARSIASDGPDATAGAASLDLRGSRTSVGTSVTVIPTDYNPELGFIRRRDMRRYTTSLAAFPRFEQSRWARQMTMAVNGEYIEGLDATKQSTSLLSHNMLSFQTGDWVMVNLRRRTEALQNPVSIQGRELAAGDYSFSTTEFRFNTNDSREFSGGGGVTVGDFWSGTRTQLSGSFAWKTGPYVTVGTNYSWNDISLPVPDGDFTTRLMGMNVLGAVSRSLFANALVQYDNVSDVVQANIRIDWIHTPGSDLFVVFDTGYLTGDLLDVRTERWSRRTGVVKLTYLKAF